MRSFFYLSLIWLSALAAYNFNNGPLFIECGVNIPLVCSE